MHYFSYVSQAEDLKRGQVFLLDKKTKENEKWKAICIMDDYLVSEDQEFIGIKYKEIGYFEEPDECSLPHGEFYWNPHFNKKGIQIISLECKVKI